MQFRLDIEETLIKLLGQEDTDGDKKITKEDRGPKSFSITSKNGLPYEVKGTYFLSNLLQELALERNLGKTEALIPLFKIEEAPSARISRMIRDYFWNDLTRTIDEEGLDKILNDEKASDGVQRIYVPYGDKIGKTYFSALHQKYPRLKMEVLPENITRSTCFPSIKGRGSWH